MSDKPKKMRQIQITEEAREEGLALFRKREEAALAWEDWLQHIREQYEVDPLNPRTTYNPVTGRMVVIEEEEGVGGP